MTARMSVVVLLSGRGSNMRAIALRALRGDLSIEIRAVISDRADSGGLATARDLGIETVAVAPRDYPDRSAFDAALAETVASFEPRLILLAGYMRILDSAFVRRFAGRLLNIHPSLLPKYPGLNTHRRALEAGDAEHGATVHFVTAELDAGPAVIQARVPTQTGDTESTLSARVQAVEHIIYPLAVEWFATGRLAMRDNSAWLDDRRLTKPFQLEESATNL